MEPTGLMQLCSTTFNETSTKTATFCFLFFNVTSAVADVWSRGRQDPSADITVSEPLFTVRTDKNRKMSKTKLK